MRLSKLSDRQLRRLIRNADVRFGLDEKEIKQLKKFILNTWDRLDSVFRHSDWQTVANFVKKPDIKNNPKLRGIYQLKSKVSDEWGNISSYLEDLIILLEKSIK